MPAGEQAWAAKRLSDMDTCLKVLTELVDVLTDGDSQALGVPGGGPPGGLPRSNRVFLVHGHKDGAMHEVARYLGKLGLEPVVLREQPNGGRTIIEKFVDYSDVAFAVVLLTRDDRGGSHALAFGDQMARARQNVILELGFFLGKLGRERVCALHEGGVEIPSDYHGVVFVSLDTNAWHLPLARELRAAGLDVDLNLAM